MSIFVSASASTTRDLAARRLLPFACLLLCLIGSQTRAGQEAARIPIVDAPPKTPGLGGGFRLSNSGDTFDLVPLYLYEGRYLFAHGTSAGIHVYRHKRFGVDLFARFRFLSFGPDDDAAFAGLEERQTTVDGGIALTGRVGRKGQVRLEWMHDLLDRSDGQEANLSYRWRYDRGRWVFSPFVNVTWHNDEFNNYYFGVSPGEAGPGRPEYEVGDAIGFEYGMNTSYQLTNRVHLFGNFGIEEFDDDVDGSPIVMDDRLIAVFVGASYMFGNGERAHTPTEERLHEWSWRLNYGYQAEGNIVGEIDQGNFKRSTRASTQIGGVTLGKLLFDGTRVDFLGRLGVYRHLEGGLQDDFWDFVSYIMVMGKGYLPWSEKTAFRWGFGFGFSYAQKVPIAEQIKQAARGEETQQFLNYLEMTLDFPLARVTKARALRNCYTGVTVVHRSGIFATSDLLGNVSGGSDWITLHLECVR